MWWNIVYIIELYIIKQLYCSCVCWINYISWQLFDLIFVYLKICILRLYSPNKQGRVQTITIIATMRLVLDHWGVTLFSNHRQSGQFIGKWFVTLLLITFQKCWYSGKCVHIIPSILFTFHLAWVNERFFKWLNIYLT